MSNGPAIPQANPGASYVAQRAALDAAISAVLSGGRYILGGGEVTSLVDLARLLVEVNGGGQFVQREFPADRKRIDIGDYYADDALIRQTLGWQPHVSLRDGLKQTLDFFRTNLDHYR